MILTYKIVTIAFILGILSTFLFTIICGGMSVLEEWTDEYKSILGICFLIYLFVCIFVIPMCWLCVQLIIYVI